MKVIEKWEDHGDRYCTIELEEGHLIDIKRPFDCPDYAYVMQCENGLEVYESGSDKGISNISLENYVQAISLANEQLCA